jgi:hypothetical protein
VCVWVSGWVFAGGGGVHGTKEANEQYANRCTDEDAERRREDRS